MNKADTFINIQLKESKKIYFASDNHLGAPNHKESLKREQRFIRWLDSIKENASAIFLLGDLFDFWFEYKKVVPKGFVRILGKLAEITDSGIPIYFFVGNHDMWMNGYFEEELNISVYHNPKKFIINNKKFLIGHGDGLGPGDYGFKRMKKVFRSGIAKFLFRITHPDVGVRIAQYLSTKNKLLSGVEDIKYKGEENEWLVQYCKNILLKEKFDYFIFGHRHLPLDIKVSETSRYINLGDWISYFSYAIFEGQDIELKYYKENG